MLRRTQTDSGRRGPRMTTSEGYPNRRLRLSTPAHAGAFYLAVA